MPVIPERATDAQSLVTKAVDSVLDSVRASATAFEKVADLVPTPTEVMEQVTATANELLSLSQDIQNKVIAALKSNA